MSASNTIDETCAHIGKLGTLLTLRRGFFHISSHIYSVEDPNHFRFRSHKSPHYDKQLLTLEPTK